MVTSIMPLELTGVEVRRRGVRLVGPINLRLEATGIAVLAGPNGSGKTTLLRVMHGLQRLSAGKVIWSGEEPDVIQRQSFVFQQPVVLRRSVIANVAYPLLLRRVSRSAARDRGAKWLETVGLTPFAERSASVLSGGEMQKLALARALVTEPDVLFLDEPTSSLDAASTQDIETLIRQAAEQGTRIVLATHDLGQLRRLADEVVFLYRGEVLEHRPAGEFLARQDNPESAAFVRGDLVL